MQKIDILVPEATTNLVKNPSFEKELSGWTSKETENWDQEATFELGALQPLVDTNPTGFDNAIPVWDKNAQLETGDLSEFDAVVDGGGKITVGAAGAHDAANGMIVANADAVAARVEMNIAANSAIILFWFNPNSIGIGGGGVITLLHLRTVGGAVPAAVVININDSAPYDLTLSYTPDGGGGVLQDTVTITDDWHFITVFWEQASAPGANDGILRWFIYDDSGNLVGTSSITTLDTDLQTTTVVWFGAIGSTAAAPTGEFYMDSIYVDVTGAPFPLSIAKMLGNYGMALPIFSGVVPRGLLTDPTNETTVTGEFRFDPNSIPMGAGDELDLVRFEGAGGSNGILELDFDGVNYRIRWRVREDGGGFQSTAFHNITDGENKIRMIWGAASGVGDNNGYGMLYLEDILQEGISGVDNDTTDVDDIIFGSFGNDAATFGIVYFDECRWANEVLEPQLTLATLTQDNTRARFDRFSGKVVTDGAVMNQGVYVRVDGTIINNQAAGSVYVRGQGKLRVRLIDALTGNTHASKPITINDKRWHRLEVTGRSGGSNDLRLYIETAESLQSVTFYIDGAQVEAKDVATVYCDGEQEGCRWNGVANLSTSTREAAEMTGGRWISIRDAECDPDTYLTIIGGFGLPPVTINRQSTAQADGSVFDSVKSEERIIQMLIWVKDEGAQKQKGLGLERIKELRQILIDLVKPDVSPDSDPFILRVTENEREFTIACRYEAGLEFDTDVRDKWRNSIPLRLLCLDPFWTEDGQEVALLDTENPLGTHLRLMGRIDGKWQLMGPGLNQTVWAVEEAPDRRIYLGGAFTADGDGNPLLRFARMNDDLTQFIQNSHGLAGIVTDVIAHPNGKIYACGSFTADGIGNLFDRIVEYDPDTDTFSALAGGIDNGTANFMDIAPNGNLYVAGSFTTVDGQPMVNVAFWDGGGWHTVGNVDAELGNISLNRILVISDDEIYITTQTDPTNTVMLIKWDGSNWLVIHADAGGGAEVALATGLAQDLDGTILFGGRGTISQATDGQVLRWNGSASTQLGEDFVHPTSVVISTIEVDQQSGLVFVGGRLTSVGSLDLPSPFAIWNGSSWVNFDFDMLFPAGSSDSIQDILSLRNGNLLIAILDPAAPVNFDAAGITTVQNTSTRDVFPVVTITGTGKIIWLENQTTGQRVYLDYTLQEDEELTIDFTEGLEVTSNYRGSVPDAVLPNSDDFFLAAGNLNEPKDNIIAVFMVDEVDPVVQLRYVPTHWSIDAAAS